MWILLIESDPRLVFLFINLDDYVHANLIIFIHLIQINCTFTPTSSPPFMYANLEAPSHGLNVALNPPFTSILLEKIKMMAK